MRWRGLPTTGVSAWRRRMSAAAWAKGLSSSVKGTGAKVKIGDIVMVFAVIISKRSNVRMQLFTK